MALRPWLAQLQARGQSSWGHLCPAPSPPVQVLLRPVSAGPASLLELAAAQQGCNATLHQIKLLGLQYS